MKISCPNCNTNYNIPDDKIPKEKASVRCKKCNQVFEIKRPEEKPALELNATDNISKEIGKPNDDVIPTRQSESYEKSSQENIELQNDSHVHDSRPQAKIVKQYSCLTVQLVDKVLESCKEKMNLEIFERNSSKIESLGYCGLYLSAILGFVYASLSATMYGPKMFMAGFGWILLVIIAQYTANKLLKASDDLIKSTPSKLSSTAFLDCLAAIFLILGILSISFFIYLALKAPDIDYLFIGVGCLMVFKYFAIISMNPQMLNIEINKNTNAGEEAIGLLSFLMKGLLKLVPVVFGTGVIIGNLDLVVAFIKFMSDDGPWSEINAHFTALVGSGTIISSALLPLIAFLVFLIYYISVDILRSILILPKKLEIQAQLTKPI